MEPLENEVASVSNNAHKFANTKKDYYDTDTILSVVNKLCFKISEEDKAKFFDELEAILSQNEEYEGYTPRQFTQLMSFFVQYGSIKQRLGA